MSYYTGGIENLHYNTSKKSPSLKERRKNDKTFLVIFILFINCFSLFASAGITPAYQFYFIMYFFFKYFTVCF